MAQTKQRVKPKAAGVPKQRGIDMASARASILEFVATEPHSLAEIRAFLAKQGASASAVSRILKQLVDDGSVTRVQRGVYQAAVASMPESEPAEEVAAIPEPTKAEEVVTPVAEAQVVKPIDLDAIRVAVDGALTRVLDDVKPEDPVETAATTPVEAPKSQEPVQVEQPELSEPVTVSEPVAATEPMAAAPAPRRSKSSIGTLETMLAESYSPRDAQDRIRSWKWTGPAPWNSTQRFIAKAAAIIVWIALAGIALMIFGNVIGGIAALVLVVVVQQAYVRLISPIARGRAGRSVAANSFETASAGQVNNYSPM